MDEKLAALNAELKAIACPIRVRRKGDRLYLRGTLPPKPGADRDVPFQQDLSLGIYANPAGLKRAKAEALRIGSDLAMSAFDWSRYYTPKNKRDTVAEWVAAFEKDYFERRERNPKSETTYYKEYEKTFSRLPPDAILTRELMLEAIAQTQPDTRQRQRFCMVFSIFSKFAGIELDTSRLRGKYSPKRVQARDLPSDELILEWRDRIPNDAWRWVYGAIAAYGLRNHEVFHLDLESIKKGALATLLDGKTGGRKIIPVPPEWWQDLELYNPILPNVTGRRNCELGARVAAYFRRLGLPFKIYDLRHCWSVRAALKGIDPSIAARLQGHSLSVHSDIYMHFLNDGHLQQVLDDLEGD